MKTNQITHEAILDLQSCTSEADTNFDPGTETKRLRVHQVDSTPHDETVLIEDLIDALHEKERLIEELKQHQTAGWSASVLGAWRRRFAALVTSSSRPTAAR